MTKPARNINNNKAGSASSNNTNYDYRRIPLFPSTGNTIIVGLIILVTIIAINILLFGSFLPPITRPSTTNINNKNNNESFQSSSSVRISDTTRKAIGTSSSPKTTKTNSTVNNSNNNNNNYCSTMPKTATFVTSLGTFKAELYTEQMPITCGNFIDLANNGFYDGIHFHRVIPDFMNQFGCPYAKNPNSNRAGTGGPEPHTQFTSCDGRSFARNDDGGIPDELTQRISNTAGTLSMANTGHPESGGSQFFINVADNTFLDWFDRSTESAHPVFGKISDNYDLVVQISNVRTRNDNPITPVQMISVRVA